MIKIYENKSYLSSLDHAAIENGVAELGVHSLRISNYYTEEEKQNNSKAYDSMTRDQWFERCEQARRECGQKVENLIDVINNNFSVYQYVNKNIKYGDHDLFFWCNSTNGSRDMSYVTLNPNDKRTNDQQLATINATLELLKGIDIEGIQVAIQYTAIYDEKKEEEIALEYCEKMKDKFIVYGGWDGKILEYNGTYYFRKKGAKKKAYFINNRTILANVLAEQISEIAEAQSIFSA